MIKKNVKQNLLHVCRIIVGLLLIFGVFTHIFTRLALLRNPALKRPAWEDYKKIVHKYRELIDPEHFSAHV